MMEIAWYLWGCMPELSRDCTDMTNASSTYLGIIGGAIVGGIVSWWIYDRQKKTSKMQENVLCRIKDLEENHDEILKKLEKFEEVHASSFDALEDLSRKIDAILEKNDVKPSK